MINEFMKRYEEFEIDFYEVNADEKAGYPPRCNEGYVEKDGKCVPVENTEDKDEAGYYKKKT